MILYQDLDYEHLNDLVGVNQGIDRATSKYNSEQQLQLYYQNLLNREVLDVVYIEDA